MTNDLTASLGLSAAQLAQVRRHGGCDLERFENHESTVARLLAYDPQGSRLQPFVVREYRATDHRRPDHLISKGISYFTGIDEARRFAAEAELISQPAPKHPAFASRA